MKKDKTAKKAKDQRKKVSFSLTMPSARQVSVAGTFNDWDSQKDLLKQNETDRWSIVMSLSPGIYEYRFVVDGVWTADPMNRNRRRNIYGGENCIVEV
jgi:1,4-alpha-glucan branching enzyme